jgi:twitching motility protein PilT
VAGLGQLLVEQGVVDDAALARAEAHRAETGSNLAQSLIALGLATESDLMRAFAASVGLPYTELGPGVVDPHAVGLLDIEVARELTALPVGFGDGDEVVVAIGDPAARDELTARLSAEMGLPVTVTLASRRALVEAIAAEAPCARHPRPQVPHRPQVRRRRRRTRPVPVPTVTRPLTGANGAGGNGSGISEAEALRARGPELTVSGPKVMSEEESDLDLDLLLKTLVERGGSDLHLTVGIPPSIRVNGELTHLDDFPVLSPDELQKLLYAIMTQKQREAFENDLELDMSYSIRDLARFRVNIFQQRNALGAVMRMIPFEILPLEKLGIPEQVSNFAYLPRGFVLVTGPTGSGKSTTLASLIDLANRNRSAHIMTVEDPIEFLHHHKRCVINQREVGTDTHGSPRR